MAVGATALLALLALLGTVCSANAAGLLITYPNKLQLATIGNSSLSDITLGKSIALPSYAAIGSSLYSTVKDNLAFTASLHFNDEPDFNTTGKSYVTVTDLSTGKVVVSRQLPGLRSGPLKGCPLYFTLNAGDIAVVRTGASSYRVYVTIACHARCKGLMDRTYVVYYTYYTASKRFIGPSKNQYSFGSVAKCGDLPISPLALIYVNTAGSGLTAVLGRRGYGQADKALSLYQLSPNKVLLLKGPSDANLTCGLTTTIVSKSDYASVCQNDALNFALYDFRQDAQAQQFGEATQLTLTGLTHSPNRLFLIQQDRSSNTSNIVAADRETGSQVVATSIPSDAVDLDFF